MAEQQVLVQIRDLLFEIRGSLASNSNRVVGGIIKQLGGDMSLGLLTPGSSPQFGVTPSPAGVATVLADTVWTSSDSVHAPVAANGSDPTGLTANVAISKSATVGHTFTLTWTYTNSDGTVATASATFTIVVTPGNVSGGALAQSA